MQYTKGSDCFCFEATLAFSRLMMSLGGQLSQLALFPHLKWGKVFSRELIILVCIDFVVG